MEGRTTSSRVSPSGWSVSMRCTSGSAVRGMHSDLLRLEVHASLDALPDDSEALFTANPGLYCTRAWWRTVLEHGVPAGSEPVLLVCRIGGRSAALFPLRRDPGGVLSSLTTPYTCRYQ